MYLRVEGQMQNTKLVLAIAVFFFCTTSIPIKAESMQVFEYEFDEVSLTSLGWNS